MVVMVVANEGQRFKILVPKVLNPPSAPFDVVAC